MQFVLVSGVFAMILVSMYVQEEEVEVGDDALVSVEDEPVFVVEVDHDQQTLLLIVEVVQDDCLTILRSLAENVKL